MATDEYEDENISIEIKSNLPIDRTSRQYQSFISGVYAFDSIASLDTITLVNNTGAGYYEYNVLTDTGQEFNYNLYRAGNRFLTYSFTTNGTIWEIEKSIKNIPLRKVVQELIVQFEVYYIEVNFL